MHEKTLLFGTLLITTVAAGIGVWRDQARAANRIGAAWDSDDAFGHVGHPGPAADTSPIRLTASDGSGLHLASFTAHAAVDDPLALTELHLAFENPEPRVREGTFRIVLPQGASLSRFAMKVGDAWQEGEVVEKQAARRAYEDFLHRKQDPALMEQGAGNEFTARVFPIPARGTKEIVIAYSEVLSTTTPYALPIKGLPAVGAIDIDVHVAGRAEPFAMHKKGITPADDFVVPLKDVPRSSGQRSGELVAARIVPFATSRPDPVSAAVVLVDTSASRGLGLKDEAELVGSVLGKLGSAPVEVAAFDQEVVSLYRGSASGFGSAGVARILARGALGASNLDRALGWAAARARDAKMQRVIVVTDGVATAGEVDGQKLRAKVEAFRAAGVARIDAVAVGGLRDDGLLRTVVRGVLDKDGAVLDGKLGPDVIAQRLGEATSSGIPITVADATWWYPKSVDGLQRGDEVVVFARMKDAASVPRIAIGTGAPAEIAVHDVERPLIERAAARAEIQSLVETPTEGPETTARRIVELSTRFRVLSPQTAMLVLESDSDYARFKIDRAAKLDILTVDGGKVRVVEADRTIPKVVDARPTPPREVDPSAGAAGAIAPAAPGAMAPATPGDTASAGRAAALSAQADAMQMQMQMLQALSGGGGSGAVGAIPPVDLSGAAPSNRGRGDLKLGAGDGPVGGHSTGLAGIGGGTAGAQGAGGERRVEGPRADCQVGGTSASVPIADADRVVAGLRARFRQCYQVGLNADPAMSGKAMILAKVAANGEVASTQVSANTGLSPAVATCLANVVRRAQFDAPGGLGSTLQIPVTLTPRSGSSAPTPDQPTMPPPPMPDRPPPAPEKVAEAAPYEGRFKAVMDLLAGHQADRAVALARRWEEESSGDVLALVALGESLEATGDLSTAARAYGSILELFPSRADSRRFAGERLERLALPAARHLAIDTFAKAAEQRPDHPASHRLLAFALLKDGQYEAAFAAIKAGVTRSYPQGRFAGADRILREDAGLIAAAWRAAEPARASSISELATQLGAATEDGPSLRFVLVWETDANDVDFHIHDGKGGHAYYSQRTLASGGELYADVTTGYGPECFTIRGKPGERAYPYILQAHYYSRGPMG